MAKTERNQRVADLYRAGAPVKDIAAECGVTQGAMFRLLWQMRKQGWDLPHRQPHRPRERE